MKTIDNHKISYFLVSFDTLSVGMTVCNSLLQVIDYQYFIGIFKYRIPVRTLNFDSNF